jgi:hypothetical protein
MLCTDYAKFERKKLLEVPVPDKGDKKVCSSSPEYIRTSTVQKPKSSPTLVLPNFLTRTLETRTSQTNGVRTPSFVLKL